MKDILKDIITHVIELIIGLYFALHIYDATHPPQEYPDYSKQLERIAVEVRNISKAEYHATQVQTDTLKAILREWQEETKAIEERRFRNYVNH